MNYNWQNFNFHHLPIKLKVLFDFVQDMWGMPEITKRSNLIEFEWTTMFPFMEYSYHLEKFVSNKQHKKGLKYTVQVLTPDFQHFYFKFWVVNQNPRTVYITHQFRLSQEQLLALFGFD